MTPVRTSLPPQPAEPTEPAPPQPLPARRLPLGLAVLLLAVGAAVLGAGCAALLQANLGVTAPWAALWGSVVGVAAAALPMAAVALKLGRPAAPAAEPSPALPGLGAVTTKALFFAWGERECARTRRYGTGAALLLVDVDRFARLRNTNGAAVGDHLLAELMRDTAATLRGTDVLTRLSDEQMAVFLAHADTTGALDVAERIRERAEHLDPSLGGQVVRITVSVGVAYFRPSHPNLQALVEEAQDALACARQAGGNCVRAAPLEAPLPRGPGSGRDDRRKPRRQPRP